MKSRGQKDSESVKVTKDIHSKEKMKDSKECVLIYFSRKQR